MLDGLNSSNSRNAWLRASDRTTTLELCTDVLMQPSKMLHSRPVRLHMQAAGSGERALLRRVHGDNFEFAVAETAQAHREAAIHDAYS